MRSLLTPIPLCLCHGSLCLCHGSLQDYPNYVFILNETHRYVPSALCTFLSQAALFKHSRLYLCVCVV